MAKDIIHNAVKNALVKDGWTITADPYQLRYKAINVQADLAAERPLIAEKGNRRIAVEVKSFLGSSLIHDFARALGQYRLYRRLLRHNEPDREMYLAVSQQVYDRFFVKDGILEIAQEEQMALLVVNTTREEIVRWIN